MKRMAAFLLWELRTSEPILSCGAQRLETLRTERDRKDTHMTTAIAARSASGFRVAGAERIAGTFETLRRAWTDHRAYRATLA